MNLRYSIDPADTDGGMAAAAIERETDPFITAARAEARDAWDFKLDPRSATEVEDLGQHIAVWARDHLAAQEVTDAEVEAAARALHIEQLGGDSFAGDAWDEAAEDAPRKAWIRDLARAALTAARAVGRDAR